MRFISQTGTTAILLLAVAFGTPVFAQGLGGITVESALNQPLRAHIELLDVSKLDAGQIRVALATDAEFKQAGVQRSSTFTPLKFQVEIQKDGSGRILVTSTDDIAEPVLDFLVGVSWPTGRTLREYTVLLDLQQNNKTATTAPPVSAPVASAAASSTTASAASATQYEVQKGDSLYQIAEATRPSASVGVQQMMVALQRANEDAFVNNNVNRILTGKVLRIPRQDEIALIDQEAAVAQINQQNQTLDSQPLAVNDSTGAKSAAPRDELTLLSGDQDTGGGGSSDLDATIKTLENQMMLSEESLDRSRLENLELTNRLAAVQEQIDLLQNIIAIEDERIAQLQKQLSSQSAATKDALASAEAAAQSANGDSLDGILDLLGNSVVLLGGLLAVAIGVALMLFVKRRNAQMAMDEDTDVSLDELADAHDAEPSGGIGSKLAAFMARFRRAEKDEHEEPVFEAAEATAPAEVVAAKAAVASQPTTDTLLDEMGISDDFTGLQNALDEADSSDTMPAIHPNAAPVAQATAKLPEKDTAVEEAGVLLEEGALLDQALHEAEQETQEEDFLQAAPEPVAATPDSFAFTTEPVKEEVAKPAVVEKTVEDKPEVFEFTLPGLDDVETEAEAAPPAAEAKEKVETISFNPSALSLDDDEVDLVLDETTDPLDVHSFEEDSLTLEDEAGEESLDIGSAQDGQDARLDLAVAYEAMGDIEGAVEILDEVIAGGKAAQVAEAQRLKQKWQNG